MLSQNRYFLKKRVNDFFTFDSCFSFEPEFSNSVRNALEEQRRQLETSILKMNRAISSPLPSVQKIQQQEQIDFLISQGKIDKAIEQVTKHTNK